eukprot:m.222710 g.222710  ORF g.222710 m.222710 type:complete len:105 (-) comp25833_c0_seq1:232-546(-)
MDTSTGGDRCDMLELQARVLRIWERKWVVLEQNCVRFYRPGVEHKLLFSLSCDKILAVTGPTTDKYVLYLQTGQYSGYRLKCFTSERAEDWKRDIVYRACKKDK